MLDDGHASFNYLQSLGSTEKGYREGHAHALDLGTLSHNSEAASSGSRRVEGKSNY